MRLYSYVVALDYGFAPNPFYGCCTLATCKPNIRKYAEIGDWVIGTGTKTRGREDRTVFAMRITEILTFEEYWAAPRFLAKRPNLRGSNKQAFGDNIYHRRYNSTEWLQENSHHSFADGTPNPKNVTRDTSVNRVLISQDFVYWGKSGPEIPPCFDIRAGRGHRCVFTSKLVDGVIQWIRETGDSNYVDAPLNW